MTSSFDVRVTLHFERLLIALVGRHEELTERYTDAIRILKNDPYNRTHRHRIKKLRGTAQGDGQYRISLGRWRFRYDIYRKEVVLHYCGLRREDTYQQ